MIDWLIYMDKNFKECGVFGSERIERMYIEEDKINRANFRKHQEHMRTIAMLERLVGLKIPRVFVVDYQI